MPKIRCECKRVLAYREDQAGKRVKCPACSAKIVLPGVGPAKAQPPGVAEASAMLNQRLSAQVAALAPTLAPRKEPPLAAQPGRRTPAHVMPSDTLKVEPAEAEIPLAGDVPTWGSEPQPNAPSAESGPRATQ
jgi:DNA-directed RNA polymerase subunit RPC12/RpoP